MVKQVDSKAEFDSTIKDNKMVVVDFFATWCGPCKMIAPKIEEMEKEYSGVVFIKVDVDENEETAAACEISAMPTFHIYKDGAKVCTVLNLKALNYRAYLSVYCYQ
uniref:Thioredoxin n=1 Tax=Magallana gigas TaxID=29159 RepID=A0A8W8L3T6_MAGGI